MLSANYKIYVISFLFNTSQKENIKMSKLDVESGSRSKNEDLPLIKNEIKVVSFGLGRSGTNSVHAALVKLEFVLFSLR